MTVCPAWDIFPAWTQVWFEQSATDTQMLPSPTVMVLVPFSVFISKEYSLSGERSEIVFMSLPFSYISAEFSPLFPPVRNKYQARSDNSRKSCRPCEILSFYHCRTPLFTVYLLLWVYHSRSFSSRQTASVWFFVLKYYTKVTIRYKISYSCNIAVIITEKAEKIVENLSKYPYSLLIFWMGCVKI